ncbi:MAG: MazG nucleotide pyrophosphohydrolase domain-containing protein, partial [Actinomycetota bacterium]
MAKSAPSLMYSMRLQKRAADLGFDWPDKTGASEKIAEELGELIEAIDSSGASEEIALELGDLLFSVVNFSRHIGVDAESALRSAAEKFRRRFEAVVALARKRDLELEKCTLDQLDALW